MSKKTDLARGVAAAVEAAGSKADLAKLLKCSRANISNWKQVPIGRVRQLETLLGLSPAILRPDIFGAK